MNATEQEPAEVTGVPVITRDDFVRLKQAQLIFRFVRAQLPKCEGLDVQCEYFQAEADRGIRDLDQLEKYFFEGSGWEINPGELIDPATLGPPLTDRQYESLKIAERKLHDLLPLFDKIEACGQDCHPLRAKAGIAAARLSKIEQNFFGQRRAG